MTDKLNELLRDLISAQDHVTSYMEKSGVARDRDRRDAYVRLMLEAQNRRHAIRAEIVTLFEEISTSRHYYREFANKEHHLRMRAEKRVKELEDKPRAVRPDWGKMSKAFAGAYVSCDCGEILQTTGQLYEHWQRGHFDILPWQAQEGDHDRDTD